MANAFSALDALPVADLLYVHLAMAHAGIAVNTLCLVHLDSKKGNRVEEGINGTQRT